MRLLLICLVLVAAGCDSTGDDAEPYAGISEVSFAQSVEGQNALRLVAVDDNGCDDPLVVETSDTATRLSVRVVGIVRPRGATCLAVIPASALIPLSFGAEGVLPVEITHDGSTDAYSYSVRGFVGHLLQAVRTSTTRLAGSE